MNNSWRSVAYVALRDLASEKLITLCLVLSVVAVLAPLMLLASVKIGFIDRIRSDFINDPSFREIRPSEADVRQDAFFADLRSWPGVAFAMPSVALTPREVDVIYSTDGAAALTEARLMPSDATDPVMSRLDGMPPQGDIVVLTSDLLEETGLALGSQFDIAVDRVEGNARKRVRIAVTIAGVLPADTMSRPTILADPSIDRDVENYRAGIAVPNRGWQGIDTAARQAFVELGVLSAAPLSETQQSDLRLRLAAAGVETVPPAALAVRAGLPGFVPDPRWSNAYVMTRASGGFSGDDMKDAVAILSNVDARVLGLNPTLTAEFLGIEFPIVAADGNLGGELAALAAEWRPGPGASFGLNDTISLPPSALEAWRDAGAPLTVPVRITLPAGARVGSIEVDLRIAAGPSPTEAALASPALIGILMRGTDVPLAFDRAARTVVEQSSGYRGFRLVAKDFRDVPALVDRLAEGGILTIARSDEILKLARLEASLDTLVAIISTVALLGGAAILAASFFANVQRKQVDYATIRLIGMRKSQVFGIPIVQAFCIAVLGFVVSCLLFVAVSQLLNEVIAAELGFDGRLSTLYPRHFVAICIGVVLGTCAASLWASREVTRIDPAQALRSA